jgi:hypothetical protein
MFEPDSAAIPAIYGFNEIAAVVEGEPLHHGLKHLTECNKSNFDFVSLRRMTKLDW